MTAYIESGLRIVRRTRHDEACRLLADAQRSKNLERYRVLHVSSPEQPDGPAETWQEPVQRLPGSMRLSGSVYGEGRLLLLELRPEIPKTTAPPAPRQQRLAIPCRIKLTADFLSGAVFAVSREYCPKRCVRL